MAERFDEKAPVCIGVSGEQDNCSPWHVMKAMSSSILIENREILKYTQSCNAERLLKRMLNPFFHSNNQYYCLAARFLFRHSEIYSGERFVMIEIIRKEICI